MVRKTSEKIDLIRGRMKAAQDRQKSYANKRKEELKFDVGDMVLSRYLRYGMWFALDLLES